MIMPFIIPRNLAGLVKKIAPFRQAGRQSATLSKLIHDDGKIKTSE